MCVPESSQSSYRNESDCACQEWMQPCVQGHTDSAPGKGRLLACRVKRRTVTAIAAFSHTGMCNLHRYV